MRWIYWIKFPDDSPRRLVAKHYEEFLHLIEREIFQHNGLPYEWLIRE
jgi:hypothetical protein